jgi:hypothetical protein
MDTVESPVERANINEMENKREKKGEMRVGAQKLDERI